ncbi:uncharacterized protein At4g06744 [Andrographis paniculata]|uniref:uncharacterized protein At4g06744 n=1 Tax=Andrographis paniculata TaxID=175694 RepID=UPI0021E7BE4D|nr:uncharacterized protein At4g06744 [Andrographis paniculata]
MLMTISSNSGLPKFLPTLIPTLLLLLLPLFFHTTYSQTTNYTQSRQALEIIIGGGGDPTSPPPDCPPPPPQPEPLIFESKRIEQAYYVIQRFKKKITCDPKGIKATWQGPDVCRNYKGFFCDTLLSTREKTLAGVTFNGYNFDGPDLSIDGFIDGLQDIIVFHANSNGFKGRIPTNIRKLQSLFELDLSNNNYTGGFPYEILGASNLTFLDLRFNRFSGSVPVQVFTLDLDVLFINNNLFFQNLPSELGSSPALYISLANNGFTGQIPASIGRAGDTLLEILLLNNRLSGCLPCEIGNLRKLTLFDATRNFLTGPIPASFACLGEMQYLNLGKNELYGPVPEMVCKLPNLSSLTLSENYFTQVGPECRKLIEKRVLHVDRNCIAGLPGQRSPAECWAFFRRAKRCADGRWFHWMPCGGQKGHHPPPVRPPLPPPRGHRPPPSPRAYRALDPYGL